MRRPALALLAGLALAAASGCTAAQLTRPAAAMTRAHAQALPAEALTRRVFGTLADGLLAYPVPPHNPRSVFRGLRELHFITPAAFNGDPGLCEAEFVAVHFAPPADPTDVDPPVRVGGMRSQRVLILRDAATVGRGYATSEAAYAREQAACAALDPRQHRLISGTYASEAALLLRWTADLLEAVRAGRPPAVPLGCGAFGEAEEDRADCLAGLAAMRIEPVLEVRRCDGPAFPRAVCYTVTDGYRALDWILAGDESGRPVRVSYYEGISI